MQVHLQGLRGYSARPRFELEYARNWEILCTILKEVCLVLLTFDYCSLYTRLKAGIPQRCIDVQGIRGGKFKP